MLGAGTYSGCNRVENRVDPGQSYQSITGLTQRVLAPWKDTADQKFQTHLLWGDSFNDCTTTQKQQCINESSSLYLTPLQQRTYYLCVQKNIFCCYELQKLIDPDWWVNICTLCKTHRFSGKHTINHKCRLSFISHKTDHGAGNVIRIWVFLFLHILLCGYLPFLSISRLSACLW